MWSAAPDPSGRPCPPSNAPLLPVASERKGGIDTARTKIRGDFGPCHVDRISIHRGGVRGGNSSDWWAGRWGVAEEKAEGCSGDVTVSHRGRLERSCNRRCVRTADEVESTPPKAKSASAASSTNEELITSRSSRLGLVCSIHALVVTPLAVPVGAAVHFRTRSISHQPERGFVGCKLLSPFVTVDPS